MMVMQQENYPMKGGCMGRPRNDDQNTKLQILIQPNIGLDSEVRNAVVGLLNITLADEAVLTTRTRCAFWNVQGADFFKLHPLFESQYQLLNGISDEIAERSQMLGGFAIGSFEEFLRHTRLEEQPGEMPGTLRLLASHETFIRFLREDARKCTEEFEDEVTFELLVRVLRLHEKIAWMLRTYIEVEL
jgi:starvation-inducible DNA-binding protein